MRKFLLLFNLFVVFVSFSQEVGERKIPVDSLFREDQFYFSVTYNLLRNTPNGYSQYSFSSGVTLGFLRDIPFSKNRDWAVGIGLGYSYNDIKHNLKIANPIGSEYNTYSIDNTYDKSKLRLHYFEIPFELRWRNATYESHKFWRIYTGFKVSYLFSSKSIFESSTENYTIKNNNELTKFQYGPYLSVGYNTINLYAYYGLKSNFDNAKIDSNSLGLNSFNIGFIFYIL
ncbi:porin family protein [Flavobacterium sp. J27]|uniref:porin family protein n=1 Tax=Flavobacterium sp. J27 TaxID=2060419 RepID=UPI00102FBEB1|nr:porin family protein [Flavobacterium sp. J27]